MNLGKKWELLESVQKGLKEIYQETNNDGVKR